jgi:hypothetical protein
MSVVINISGDFCITPGYLGNDLLTTCVKDTIANADINIVNLECPVIKDGNVHKIIKHGPHLQTTEKIFYFLRQLNVTAVTLANNHMLDHGEEGVENTLAACKKNNILPVGAGSNLKEAGQHLVLEKNHIKIAIVNFCENEWSVATESTAGANPLDIIENLAQIKKAKQSADMVLVIFHGGSEYYHLPTPAIKKMFRFFADNGADAVISHHTHCISGYEVYNKVPLLYGLGNMLFTKQSDEPGWFTGLTAQLTVQKGQPVRFSFIPTHQSATYQLSVPGIAGKEAVLKEVERLSSIIADDNSLKKEWNNLVEKRSAQYLYTFSAVPALPGRYIKSSFRRLGFVNKLLPKKYLTGIINYITCETHREIATEALKNKLFKK